MKGSKILLVWVTLFLTVMPVVASILPDEAYITTERRKTKTLTKLSIENIINGSFMNSFEDYSLDQFPLRETFRNIKANFSLRVLRASDNNGLVMSEGHIGKLITATDTKSLDYASSRFNYVYDKYLKNSEGNIYSVVIPDKVNYMGEALPVPDYFEMVSYLKSNGGEVYKNYIEIYDLLELEDYYRTDSHWRQEKIGDIAARIADALGVELNEKIDIHEGCDDFLGVYAGQSAMRPAAESLFIAENDIINNAIVTDYETNTRAGVYNMEALDSVDPYEVYLYGSRSLLTIENPSYKGSENDASKDELIVFRDSFGSSIAPYLIEGYRKITLVDIRYIMIDMLDKFIDFDNQDILFMYSQAVLNNSNTIK